MRIPIIITLLAIAPILRAVPEGDPVFQRWHDRIDPAIENALDYLAGAQLPDGSFPGRFGDTTGVASLVGMAFLSKGHTPLEGPYAGVINRCLDYVFASQQENGLYQLPQNNTSPMYSHFISTLFLTEASGMVEPARQSWIDASLPRAIQLILRAQAVRKSDKSQGGWRYHPGSTDSDTSCSGWAIMALRSAKHNGAAVPDKAIDDAIAYLLGNRTKEGGFAYNGGRKTSVTLTGMALLCLQLCGQHASPEAQQAADWLFAGFRGVVGDNHEAYGNYYNAQAMFQMGGQYWQQYADWMYGHYLGKQSANGSWPGGDSVVYQTAMMTLAFTVPYRQLPIYQRDETVDEKP